VTERSSAFESGVYCASGMTLFPFSSQMTEFDRLTSEITSVIESVPNQTVKNVDHVSEDLAGLRNKLTMVLLGLEEKVVEHVQQTQATQTCSTALLTGHHRFLSCRLQSSTPFSQAPARTLCHSDLSVSRSSFQFSDCPRSSRSTVSSTTGGEVPLPLKRGNLSALSQLRTAKLAQLDESELDRPARLARPAHLVLGRRGSEFDCIRQACDASQVSLFEDHAPWVVNASPAVVVDDEQGNSPRDSIGENPQGSPKVSPRPSIEPFIGGTSSMEYSLDFRRPTNPIDDEHLSPPGDL